MNHGIHVSVTATKEPVAIWSGEHRAWWGPDRCGYFTDPRSAGTYSMEDACMATHHVGPEKQIEIKDAPFFLPDRIGADLSAIEALTDWVRHNLNPPSADLVYAAAGAVANLRHKLAKLEERT